MTIETQLDNAYIAIGEWNTLKNGPIPEELFEEAWRLENLLRPKLEPIAEKQRELFSYCGADGCNGEYCLECAAIRGGCPEDV